MKNFEAVRQIGVQAMEAGRGGSSVSASPVPLEPDLPSFCSGSRTAPTSRGSAPDVAPSATIRVRPSPDDDADPRLALDLIGSVPTQPLTAFEIIGGRGSIAIQLVAAPADAARLISTVQALYPNIEAFMDSDLLREASDGRPFAARGYRLRRSHLFAMRTEPRPDAFGSLLAAFASLPEGEWGAYQVIFRPVAAGWRDAIIQTARDDTDPRRSRFYDLQELPRLAEAKSSTRLYAVSLRLAASSERSLRTLEEALSGFSGDNSLEPMKGPYPSAAVLARANHASGMVLNANELAALAHVPSQELADSDLPLETASVSAPPPEDAVSCPLLTLGVNAHRGVRRLVGISEERLRRHCAVFGGTGAGKSTLLLRFADLLERTGPDGRPYGLAFLDPHGDTAEMFLDFIPEHRVPDVIYFNPGGDKVYAPALNVFATTDERERELLAKDVLLALRRLFERTWTVRQEWLLRQSIRTLLASRGEKTLRDLPRLLSEGSYRDEVLATVDDPDLQYFWRRQFSPRQHRQSVDAILTKMSKFLDDPDVRSIVSQQNRIDFHRVMNDGMIFVGNFSEALLGADAASLLMSFILTKLQIAALARAAMRPEERRLFVIVIDEFHRVAGAESNTESICSFLSEARKHGVALAVATQYVGQLAREVRSAVFGNAGSLVCLRSGIEDAALLQRELGDFTCDDIMDLGVGEALARMGRSADSFNVRIIPKAPPPRSFREEIIAHSRERYCRPRAEVDEELRSGAPAAHSLPAELPALESDAERFLRHVAENPEQPVTKACASLAFGGSKADRLRRWLKDAGLMVEVKTRLGARGTLAIFALPTLLAYKTLGLELPGGRGGPIHRHFQRVVADRARGRGYEASIEHRIPNGSVDVHLERDGRRIAVEITVRSTPERDLAHIEKCLKADYDQVLLLFTDDDALQETRRLIKDKLGELNDGRIALRHVNDLATSL